MIAIYSYNKTETSPCIFSGD